jgi:hypothetical protein
MIDLDEVWVNVNNVLIMPCGFVIAILSKRAPE